jgi:hypothetical protein
MNKILLIAVIITLIILGPLIIIWSLNTLFSLGINYGVAEWLAALVLGGMLQQRNTTNR